VRNVGPRTGPYRIGGILPRTVHRGWTGSRLRRFGGINHSNRNSIDRSVFYNT
jgi:hypothetical protein